MEVGENEAATPEGSPETERATEELNPLMLVAETV
jgi:hypothetical protein